MKLGLYLRELSDHSRFFSQTSTRARRLVFYSERDIYYQYYESLLAALLEDETIEIGYLTSDHHDPLFQNHHPRLKVFYVDKLLPSTLAKLRADVLVMTMPDLHRFHIKKSPGTRNHIYMFHAVVSTHLQYRKGAFDDYDTIFCVGPHHVREIRRAEELSGRTPKRLVESGYHRLENIYRRHLTWEGTQKDGGSRTVLIAPTWGSSSLLEQHTDQLVEVLARMDGWVSVIRPHPEFIKRNPGAMKVLTRRTTGQRNIRLEIEMTSEATLHAADVLITDRSGIAYEYSFGTERPTLFIDTPLKINNPEYAELGIEPMEISTRGTLGVAIAPNEIQSIPSFLGTLVQDRLRYRESIVAQRERSIFHWMKSAGIEADFIRSQLQS